MQYLTVSDAIARAMNGGLSKEEHVGVRLPRFNGTFAEGWATGDPEKATLMHATVYGGAKIKNMLVTDSVKGALRWMKDAPVTEGDAARWHKVFQRDVVGFVPYLSLQIRKGEYKVTVPVTKSFFDPLEGDVYIVKEKELREGIGQLRKVLHGGLYRVEYIMVDGSVRHMATSLDQGILEAYYGVDKDTALSEMKDIDKDTLARKRDGELVGAVIRVPDMEAPIKDGVFRTMNVLEIKKIEPIGLDQIDRWFVHFDADSLKVGATQNYGSERASGYFTGDVVERYGLKTPEEGETVPDYITRSLDYTHTSEKRALAEACSVVLDRISPEFYLGERPVDVSDLFA